MFTMASYPNPFDLLKSRFQAFGQRQRLDSLQPGYALSAPH
jgi:hypothetical protein